MSLPQRCEYSLSIFTIASYIELHRELPRQPGSGYPSIMSYNRRCSGLRPATRGRHLAASALSQHSYGATKSARLLVIVLMPNNIVYYARR